MRPSVPVETSDAFRHPPGYGRQYTNVYQDRLARLRPRVEIPADWCDAQPQSRVLDLPVGHLAHCVGCIVRKPAHKLNIFADLKQIYHGIKPVHAAKYASEADELFFEDEHGRVPLAGLPAEFLVTGTVAAVLGVQTEAGVFDAVAVQYPSTPLPPPVSAPPRAGVAVVCGLALAEDIHEGMRYNLLLEYLLTTPVAALVIAGNSLAEPDAQLVGSRVLRPSCDAKAFAQFDLLVQALCRALPVYVLPGPTDPAPTAFPQLPIHAALFARGRALIAGNLLHTTTNPQLLDFGGVRVLVTAGQPIADLARYDYADKLNDLDLIEKTLQFGHIAPTAPDTLWTYPYVEDPLVLEEKPHVYISGNARAFASGTRAGVRCLALPPFATTGALAVLDLDTLNVEHVEFA